MVFNIKKKNIEKVARFHTMLKIQKVIIIVLLSLGFNCNYFWCDDPMNSFNNFP